MPQIEIKKVHASRQKFEDLYVDLKSKRESYIKFFLQDPKLRTKFSNKTKAEQEVIRFEIQQILNSMIDCLEIQISVTIQSSDLNTLIELMKTQDNFDPIFQSLIRVFLEYAEGNKPIFHEKIIDKLFQKRTVTASSADIVGVANRAFANQLQTTINRKNKK